ncbi:ATP-NAD kinase [Halorientalis halophila]|uniref:ATP-NAD kinase n=1 Tax=Halorientalis halophila TaxID=3108499 RepID=UPI003008BCB8
MSDPAERPVVGVLGESAEPIVAAVEAAGGRAETGDTDAVYGVSPDALVAVGEAPLLALASRSDAPSVPILPVDAGECVPSVPRSAVTDAVDALVSGGGDVAAYPVVGVRVDGAVRARALLDVTLLTAEPARISEYAVVTGDDTVARFRADGVVVATPAGTHGYTRRVDGPVVAANTGVAAITPIAPFATDADRWVLDLERVSLRVERDEVPVELLADDRRIGGIDPGVPVSLSVVDDLSLLTVSASRSPLRVPTDE